MSTRGLQCLVIFLKGFHFFIGITCYLDMLIGYHASITSYFHVFSGILINNIYRRRIQRIGKPINKLNREAWPISILPTLGQIIQHRIDPAGGSLGRTTRTR